MPELSLRLLGSPRVLVDGAPVVLGRRRALALLAFLAVEPGPVGRDRLAAVFWPDEDPASARAALRRMLSVLRASLGDSWIGGDRDAIELAGTVHVDAVALRDAARSIDADGYGADLSTECAARLGAAAGLYDGDFLAGFSLPGCPAFDEWQTLETETLRDSASGLLDRLADWHETRSELDRAIDLGRRRLAVDLLHEPAHARLMRLYALAGRRASALRQYGECARILEAELGETPGEETVRLFEAVRSGELRPAAESRPVARESGRTRLPAATTPFLGREAELDDLAKRLADPACRLVTIAGSGGVGKTRLAVEAASRNAAHFPDGVFFVPLARATSPELIAPAIADAVDAVFEGRRDLETLTAYLRDRGVLLVLDNFEHLVEGAGTLGALLEGAPRLKLVATSRERLGLRGEWLVDLRGFPYPSTDAGRDLDSFESVRLFLDAAARAGFAPGPDDHAHVARICNLVEGLPLGIELAAAWVRVLSCEEIAREIRRSLDFLTGSLRDAPERHRSMRAVFQPSWEMLSPDERDAIARLSVFRGRFGREAAEAVAGAPLTVLASLVDKSLLNRCPAWRYDIHELVRQFAAEKLDEIPGGAEETLGRHCAHYGRFLDGLRSLCAPDVFAGMCDEIENVRAGWEWAVGRGRAAEIARYLDPLFKYYDMQGWYEEGERTFEQAADALEASDVDCTVLAKAMARQGAFATNRGRFVEAREALECAVHMFREHGERSELARALNRLGVLWHQEGNADKAARCLTESMEVYRALGDRAGEARVLGSLGYSAGEQRRYDEALGLMEESLALNREFGDAHAIATSLNDLGYVFHLADQNERARALLEEALDVRRELKWRKGVAVTLDNLGHVALALGEPDAARDYFLESLEVAHEIQAIPVVLDVALGLATLAGAADVLAFVRDHPASWTETKEDAARHASDLAQMPAGGPRDLDEVVETLKRRAAPA